MNCDVRVAVHVVGILNSIYFHTPSRNQTKLRPVEKYWLKSFIMFLPSTSLINWFSSFLLIIYQARCY